MISHTTGYTMVPPIYISHPQMSSGQKKEFFGFRACKGKILGFQNVQWLCNIYFQEYSNNKYNINKIIIKKIIFSRIELVLMKPFIFLLTMGYKGLIPCLVMASINKCEK